LDDIDEPSKDVGSPCKDDHVENRRVSDEYAKYGQSEVNHQLLDDIDEPPEDEDSSCEDDHFPVENRRALMRPPP
jgi:hypothetical protein